MQSDVNFPLVLCKPTSQIIQPKFNQCKRFVLHPHFSFIYLTISILGSFIIFWLFLKYTLRFVPSRTANLWGGIYRKMLPYCESTEAFVWGKRQRVSDYCRILSRISRSMIGSSLICSAVIPCFSIISRSCGYFSKVFFNELKFDFKFLGLSLSGL